MNPNPSCGLVRLCLLRPCDLHPDSAADRCCLGPAHTGGRLPRHQGVNDASGSRLQVDGRDFMVFGMNWGYMPIGQNYTYDFWDQAGRLHHCGPGP